MGEFKAENETLAVDDFGGVLRADLVMERQGNK